MGAGGGVLKGGQGVNKFQPTSKMKLKIYFDSVPDCEMQDPQISDSVTEIFIKDLAVRRSSSGSCLTPMPLYLIIMNTPVGFFDFNFYWGVVISVHHNG